MGLMLPYIAGGLVLVFVIILFGGTAWRLRVEARAYAAARMWDVSSPGRRYPTSDEAVWLRLYEGQLRALTTREGKDAALAAVRTAHIAAGVASAALDEFRKRWRKPSTSAPSPATSSPPGGSSSSPGKRPPPPGPAPVQRMLVPTREPLAPTEPIAPAVKDVAAASPPAKHS